MLSVIRVVLIVVSVHCSGIRQGNKCATVVQMLDNGKSQDYGQELDETLCAQFPVNLQVC